MNGDFIPQLVEFLKEKEGCELEAYQDIAGVWTIGYGHTKGVKKGDRITKEEACIYLEEDIKEHLNPLDVVKVPLSNNQKVALGSFIYNVGANNFLKSTMLKKLNNFDYIGASCEFERFIYSGGKISRGLINRRKAEKELFLT